MDSRKQSMFLTGAVQAARTRPIRSASKWLSMIAFGIAVGSPCMSVRSEDYISPELVKVTTPLYHPWSGDFQPAMGTYTYTVSWEGIPAATATVKISDDGSNYQVNALAETYSGIDLFYKLRYQMNGTLAGADLSPIHSSTNHRENSRIKTLDIDFDPSGEIRATREQVGKQDSKREIRFVSNNLTLDPIGAAFMARSLNWSIGESKTFDVFNGKSRYLVTLSALEKSRVLHQGVMRDVWVITPRVKNLTTTEPVQKLREAKIFLTTDSAREILKIESSVFIGKVYTELDSFEPSLDQGSATRMAQLRRPKSVTAVQR